MPDWVTILLAGSAMFVRDILCTLITIADSRGSKWAAAGLSVALELAGIASLGLGVFLINAHGWSVFSVWLVASICVGSAAASIVGVPLGQRWIGRPLPAEH
jgi:hypothetical protein